MLGMCGRGDSHHRRQGPRHPHRAFPERGWIQFLLLRLLDEEPTHGYQLMEELEDRGYVRSGRFETGSVYTILHRMEERGLLSSTKGTSEAGRVRRIYGITQAGREALKRGLERIIRQKKVMDDLAEYYREHYQPEEQDRTPDEERNEER